MVHGSQFIVWLGFPCVYCGKPVHKTVNVLIVDNEGNIVGPAHETCSAQHRSKTPYEAAGVAEKFIGASFAVDQI